MRSKMGEGTSHRPTHAPPRFVSLLCPTTPAPPCLHAAPDPCGSAARAESNNKRRKAPRGAAADSNNKARKARRGGSACKKFPFYPGGVEVRTSTLKRL